MHSCTIFCYAFQNSKLCHLTVSAITYSWEIFTLLQTSSLEFILIWQYKWSIFFIKKWNVINVAVIYFKSVKVLALYHWWILIKSLYFYLIRHFINHIYQIGFPYMYIASFSKTLTFYHGWNCFKKSVIYVENSSLYHRKKKLHLFHFDLKLYRMFIWKKLSVDYRPL